MKPFYEAIPPDAQHPSYQLLEVELFKCATYWHYHPQIELTYVLAGSGIRMVGDHLGQFKPGDLMLTGENLPHDFNMRDKGESALFLVLQFHPDIVTSFPELGSVSNMLRNARKGLLFQSIAPELEQQLLDFQNLSPPKQIISLMQLLLQMSEITQVTELCSESFAQSPPGTAQTNRVNLVVDHVSVHFTRSIELQEVADIASMTQQSFCRWFRQTMGCSFVTYLNRYRIEQASRWLVETDKPIGLIANMCGFESLSSFNRAFKKCKESSPSQYRQNWHQSS